MIVRAGIVIVLAAALQTGCGGRERRNPVAGGDPEAGRAAIAGAPCVNCHVIPGVASRGVVGPPLSGWARRAFLGGTLPNTPDYVVRWIRNAPSFEPEVAMPAMDISEQDARDMAAYLWTLQ